MFCLDYRKQINKDKDEDEDKENPTKRAISLATKLERPGRE